MKFRKRQLILAGMVVCLGAAVYVNWQLSGTTLETAPANAEAETSHVGDAQLVNASWLEEHPVISEPEEGSASMEAEAGETAEPADATVGNEDYFAQALLDRQKARDTALETLQTILDNPDASTEETQKAVDESAAIARNMVAENNIENLVIAKGYPECVAFLQADSCSIVVSKEGEFTETDAVTIQDIVCSQCELTCQQIHIVSYTA